MKLRVREYPDSPLDALDGLGEGDPYQLLFPGIVEELEKLNGRGVEKSVNTEPDPAQFMPLADPAQRTPLLNTRGPLPDYNDPVHLRGKRGSERYSPQAREKFLVEANVALRAIQKLHADRRYDLLEKLDPSGALLSGECSVLWAVMCVMRAELTILSYTSTEQNESQSREQIIRDRYLSNRNLSLKPRTQVHNSSSTGTTPAARRRYRQSLSEQEKQAVLQQNTTSRYKRNGRCGTSSLQRLVTGALDEPHKTQLYAMSAGMGPGAFKDLLREVARWNAVAQEEASAPRCPHGHLMLGDNVRERINSKGYLARECLECIRARARAYTHTEKGQEAVKRGRANYQKKHKEEAA